MANCRCAINHLLFIHGNIANIFFLRIFNIAFINHACASESSHNIFVIPMLTRISS